MKIPLMQYIISMEYTIWIGLNLPNVTITEGGSNQIVGWVDLNQPNLIVYEPVTEEIVQWKS